MDTPVEEHRHRHRHRHKHRRVTRRFASQAEDRFLIVLAIVISLALVAGILWLLDRPVYKLW